MGRRIVRIEPRWHGRGRRAGVVDPIELTQNIAEIRMGDSIVGIDRDRAGNQLGGRLKMAWSAPANHAKADGSHGNDQDRPRGSRDRSSSASNSRSAPAAAANRQRRRAVSSSLGLNLLWGSGFASATDRVTPPPPAIRRSAGHRDTLMPGGRRWPLRSARTAEVRDSD